MRPPPGDIIRIAYELAANDLTFDDTLPEYSALYDSQLYDTQASENPAADQEDVKPTMDETKIADLEKAITDLKAEIEKLEAGTVKTAATQVLTMKEAQLAQMKSGGPATAATTLPMLIPNFYAASNTLERWLSKTDVCEGGDKGKTLDWIRRVDEAPGNIQQALASESTTGPLHAHVLKFAGKPWDALKKSVTLEFISNGFHNSQKEALRNLKQKACETLKSYNYKTDKTAAEAYPEGLPTDQSDLIRWYLTGLKDYPLGKSVAKKNPATLLQAMEYVEEKARLPLLIGEKKPMDLAYAIEENAAKTEEKITALTAAVERMVSRQQPPQQQTAAIAAPAAKLICYQCKQAGHKANACPNRPSQPSGSQKPTYAQASNPNWNRGQLRATAPAWTPTNRDASNKCLRCRREGHWARECRAPPPTRPCRCGQPHWFYDCPRKAEFTGAPAGTPQAPRYPAQQSGN